MSSSTLPEYGTPEYTKFQNEYDGSKPARVNTHNISCETEMEDCMERLFLRQDFHRAQLADLIKIIESPNPPKHMQPILNKLMMLNDRLKYTLQQACSVIKQNKKLMTSSARVKHFEDLDTFLKDKLEQMV